MGSWCLDFEILPTTAGNVVGGTLVTGKNKTLEKFESFNIKGKNELNRKNQELNWKNEEKKKEIEKMWKLGNGKEGF